MDGHPESNGHLAHIVREDGHLVQWWLGFTVFDYRRVYPVIGDHFAICAVCEELDLAVRSERVLGHRVVEHAADTADRRADFARWQESKQRVRSARAAYEALTPHPCPLLLSATSR